MQEIFADIDTPLCPIPFHFKPDIRTTFLINYMFDFEVNKA